MTFGFGFGFPRIQGVGAFSPASLFASGEVGVWYDPSDLSTLLNDTTGNTAITTPGQTVAVMVDKSKPYVSVTSLPTMTCSASVTQSGNVLTFNNSLAGDQASGSGISATGFYAMTFTVAGTGSVAVYIGAGLVVFSAGTHTLKTWYAAAATFFIFRANAGGFNGTVTFTERRDYLGNHAAQGTAASRPTYGIVPYTGRRNLLLWTEDFTNAVWTKTNITLTSGIVDPNGGTAAFTFTSSAANGSVSRNVGSLAAGSSISFWIKRRTGTGAVAMWDGNSYVNVTVTNSWTRVQINQEVLTTGFWDMRLVVSGDAVDVAFPQVETASVATAYQRVTTQYDVTEAGVQSLSYLGFDGADDFMLTGTITPGVDKAQVFAGIRKLSDASGGIVVELSIDVGVSNGAFYLAAPESSAINYTSLSRGNFPIGASQRADIFTGAAPETAVVSATHDIPGSLSTIRRNTIAGVNGTGFKGTGNFLAYPLYIGRRAGTSLPFSGNIYGLITRFSATNMDAANITNTEAWLNQRTGAY